jgi:hypothetical protein
MKGFDPRAEDFHPANAVWLGRASRLAYCESAEITATVGSWGMRADIPDGGGMNQQAFLAHDDEKVIVVFRGTQADRWRGWFWDMLVHDLSSRLALGWAGQDLKETSYDQRPDKSRGVSIYSFHGGFLNAFVPVWRLTRFPQLLRAAATPGKPIWFTGHSMGAAFSLLAAVYWLGQGGSAQGVYLYGAPRVGNLDFASDYDRLMGQRTFRLVNFVDPITHIPLFAGGFVHVGRNCVFDRNGQLHMDYDSLQTALTFWLRDLWRSPRLALSFRSHAMVRYCELTERAAREAGVECA